MSLSEIYANAILDLLMRDTRLRVPSAWVSLHNGNPLSLESRELAGGQYERQEYRCDRALGGKCANADVIDFVFLPAASITHIAVWDAPEGGQLIFSQQADDEKSVSQDDAYRIEPGQLSISFRISV